MAKKRTSLYEETKIQMVMKIHNISRNKAIDYICNPDKTDDKIFISSYACSQLCKGQHCEKNGG